jgi:hypothetical protein
VEDQDYLPIGKEKTKQRSLHKGKRQPIETVMKEEEHTFQCAQEAGRDEILDEWIKIFSHEVEQEMIQEGESTKEERAGNSINFVHMCQELKSLKRRVKTQGQLIQQVGLEVDKKEKMKQGSLHEREKNQPLN